MSKPKSCVSALSVAALTSIALLTAGCDKKKAENQEAKTATPAAAPMVSEKTGTPGVTATEIKIGQSTTYSGPVSNNSAALNFRQHIGQTDALRTGAYSKTLTFTLSTTNP